MAYAEQHRIYGMYGRWCDTCKDYRHMAILVRIGDLASTAAYIPTCPTCRHILMPVKPGDGF